MQQHNTIGYWMNSKGISRAIRMKGGALYDAFFGVNRGGEGQLSASQADMARAYTSAVWAYRAVKLRADAVASVPLQLLDRDGSPIEDHPVLYLLRDVNPHTMNLGDLLRATESAYNIFGSAYWLLVRSDTTRRIKWIQWLNPQTVEPVRDSQRGIIAYRQQIGGTVREFAPEDVIVFRNFDPMDDLGGLSPMSIALNEINADLNAARYVADFFSNDARPAGLLTTEHQLVDAEIERVGTWWQKLFSGVGNRWKTGIVGSGLKWQPISHAPVDLALSELRAEDRRAICAVFGVPPGMAGAWESTTYANAREQKASFYQDTILPQLNYIAEVLTWSLLANYPDLTARGARLAFDEDSIAALRESVTEKANRVIALLNAGIITLDEARARLNLTPMDSSESVIDSPSPLVERGPGGEAAKSTLDDDLARWRRFAIKRVKAGRDLRPFESDVIPAALHQQISDALADASTPDDVVAAFDELFPMRGKASTYDPMNLSTCSLEV